MSNRNWGGKRPGAGRPPVLGSELEFQKFACMDKLSDRTPILRLPIEMPCQTEECPNMTTQGIIQKVRGIWNIRPICPDCTVASGHRPLE